MAVTPERGFGGKCFPKDMIALLGRGREIGVDLELLSTVWKINKKIRTVKDWGGIPFAVSSSTKKEKQTTRKK